MFAGTAHKLDFYSLERVTLKRYLIILMEMLLSQNNHFCFDEQNEFILATETFEH